MSALSCIASYLAPSTLGGLRVCEMQYTAVVGIQPFIRVAQAQAGNSTNIYPSDLVTVSGNPQSSYGYAGVR